MLRAARRMFSTVATLSLAARPLAASLETVGVNRVKLLAVRLEPPEVRLLTPVVHTTPYLCPHDSISSATGVCRFYRSGRSLLRAHHQATVFNSSRMPTALFG
eukprot:COSAG03_NODE_38_length_17530_cov_148.572223_6_plen_103_part_00